VGCRDKQLLPPLAGSGLFACQDGADRAKLKLKKGPFEFRIKESPVIKS
jgi:hypothetical protein